MIKTSETKKIRPKSWNRSLRKLFNMTPRNNDGAGTSSEIIDLKFLKKDDDNKEMLKHIAIGGGAGWLTGFVSMKVGKFAATAVAGSIIVLQVANHKGYIKINWNRLNSDVAKVKSKIQEEATGRKADWTEKLEKKLERKTKDLVNRQRRWFDNFFGEDEDKVVKDVAIMAGSFVVGFALGVVSGH